jgi:hypothetical protein
MRVDLKALIHLGYSLLDLVDIVDKLQYLAGKLTKSGDNKHSPEAQEKDLCFTNK